jgi:hypothetical protein
MAALSMSALEGEADMAGPHPNVRLLDMTGCWLRPERPVGLLL